MTLLAFTRPAAKLDESIRLAESMGFRVLAAPSLESSSGDADDFERFRSKVNGGKRPVAIFASDTAVTEFHGYFGDTAVNLLDHCDVVSIGAATARCLKDIHVDSEEPDVFSSYGIAEMLKDRICGRDVLVVRSDKGSDVLRTKLEGYGARVDDIVSYRLRSCGMTSEMKKILGSEPDAMAFTSPLSARSFFDTAAEHLGRTDFLSGRTVAAIGRPTADELIDMGIEVQVIPARSTFEDLLKAICEYFKGI